MALLIDLRNRRSLMALLRRKTPGVSQTLNAGGKSGCTSRFDGRFCVPYNLPFWEVLNQNHKLVLGVGFSKGGFVNHLDSTLSYLFQTPGTLAY